MSFIKRLLSLTVIFQIILLPVNIKAGEIFIDRTPPTLYETGANPMTLSPASDVPFTTTIVYKIKDTSDCTASITITNQSTGEVVATYNPAPATSISSPPLGGFRGPNEGVNSVIFNANPLPKGSYRATIVPSLIIHP